MEFDNIGVIKATCVSYMISPNTYIQSDIIETNPKIKTTLKMNMNPRMKTASKLKMN